MNLVEPREDAKEDLLHEVVDVGPRPEHAREQTADVHLEPIDENAIGARAFLRDGAENDVEAICLRVHRYFTFLSIQSRTTVDSLAVRCMIETLRCR